MKSCRICSKALGRGCTVTCGRSFCQQASYLESAVARTRKGSTRHAELSRELSDILAKAVR